MFALNDELITILPKSTNIEASLSKMDRVFIIILLLNLKPDFENIWEQILTIAVIPNFDEVLAWLLRHTSTATRSMRSEITPDTFVMVSQSHSQSDSRGERVSNRGRGQHPQCTYCHRLGHTRDRCYQLHSRPSRTAHLAQSSDHSPSSSLSSVLGSSSTPQGVIRPVNMRSTFVSLKQPNLPPLLMFPRPVMSLLALHIHLHHESLILEPLIISLVIKTFFLLLPFHLLYPLLP